MAWRHMNFVPVNFVKPNTVDSFENKYACSVHDGVKKSLSGKDAKEFYEEVVNSRDVEITQRNTENDEAKRNAETKSGPSQSAKVNMIRRVENKPEISRKQVKPALLLKAAQEGDLDVVESFISNGVDLNTQDQYGWTPLMCAVQAKQFDIVRLLLSRGVSRSIVNNKGWTALHLAQKAKSRLMISLLEKETLDGDSSTVAETALLPFRCEVCDLVICDTDLKSHETSTVHLFNLKIQPKQVPFNIPETNPGYKMMLRSGWDDEGGLGPSGKGRLFPVKTHLKRDRKGLGCKMETTAKVTHFSANDSEAIKTIKELHKREMKLSTLSKKEMKRKKRIEQRKEISFRNAFNVD